MQAIIFLFFLYLVSCASSGFNVRSLASTKCNINNYQDFVFQSNKQPPACDLKMADLRGKDLRWANLSWANLRLADLQGALLYHAKFFGADLTGAKVTAKQAKYLKSQNITGFVIVE